jgi:hypothetical protein
MERKTECEKKGLMCKVFALRKCGCCGRDDIEVCEDCGSICISCDGDLPTNAESDVLKRLVSEGVVESGASMESVLNAFCLFRRIFSENILP